MALHSLALDHFRSHTALFLKNLAQTIIITGGNGSGKTNILEACSLLAPGRGLRHKPAEQMLSHTAPNNTWSVTADLTHTPHCPLSITYKNNSLHRTCGQQILSASDLPSWLSVWWHTPLVDHLLQTPSARRQIIDRCTSRLYTSHIKNLNAYKHYALERINLLNHMYPCTQVIDTLEDRLVDLANTITHERFATLTHLEPYLHNMSDMPMSLSIKPTSSLETLWIENPEKMQDHLATKLKSNRDKDKLLKRTLTSVQNAAFDFLLHKKEKIIPFTLGSTGERKLCALGILIASLQHYQSTKQPSPSVFLLDETLTHMDPSISQHLAEFLQSLHVQIWCTSYNTNILEHFSQAQHITLSE